MRMNRIRAITGRLAYAAGRLCGWGVRLYLWPRRRRMRRRMAAAARDLSAHYDRRVLRLLTETQQPKPGDRG